MNPQHIVILGGTGFVGQHLVPRLARDGHRITVLSRNRTSLRQLYVLPNVRIETANVFSQGALVERFAGADAVVNLVGILNERGFSGSGFRRAHVELTQTVIDACRVAGVPRLLQMSALNAGRGRSHYLRTRGEAEAAVKASALDWTIFQPSVIFGRGDGLFRRFAFLLGLTPVLPLARAGTKFAPVYVGDVAEAFARALRDPGTVRQTYELYGPAVLTLADIVRYTARHRGLRRLVIPLPDALGRLQATVMDFVPGKPFSTDNYLSLALDSVGGIDGLFRLGIEKTPIDAVVPDLLTQSPRQAQLDRNRALR
ncbi:complex I NDUFA9 subunit family protein [Chiayiivirga flava]|uniref:NADH dehydrogenase n=1 Tax=Chiayiivirga flava TaxID=659595 RepID=A0A7W8G2N3_9GAMM|nr:complex I NDUFA9 subunit family protein [Chiayiivirga flava]MBB5208895.1 NADH dehydrogenase [Chiayiivirga flava]